MKRLLLFALCLVLPSCNFVYSDHPVGEPVAGNDLDGIEGRWMNEDGDVFAVKLDPMEAGHLTIDPVEEDIPAMYIRRSGDWLFLNFRNASEEKDDPTWFWTLLKVNAEGNRALLWVPHPDRFAELVRAGKLKGRVEEKKARQSKVVGPDGKEQVVNELPSLTVVITDPDQSWVSEMVDGKFGVPFDWTDPAVFVRVDEDGKPVTQEPPPPLKPNLLLEPREE